MDTGTGEGGKGAGGKWGGKCSKLQACETGTPLAVARDNRRVGCTHSSYLCPSPLDCAVPPRRRRHPTSACSNCLRIQRTRRVRVAARRSSDIIQTNILFCLCHGLACIYTSPPPPPLFSCSHAAFTPGSLSLCLSVCVCRLLAAAVDGALGCNKAASEVQQPQPEQQQGKNWKPAVRGAYRVRGGGVGRRAKRAQHAFFCPCVCVCVCALQSLGLGIYFVFNTL